jgi:hypothetical protein
LHRPAHVLALERDHHAVADSRGVAIERLGDADARRAAWRAPSDEVLALHLAHRVHHARHAQSVPSVTAILHRKTIAARALNEIVRRGAKRNVTDHGVCALLVCGQEPYHDTQNDQLRVDELTLLLAELINARSGRGLSHLVNAMFENPASLANR